MTYRAVHDPPDWNAIMNKRVRLHRNLQTKWIVVQVKIAGVWTVVGATQSCLIKDVRFVVQKSRRDWIVVNNKRHVCAWSEGTLIGIAAIDPADTPIPLGYNPFLMAEFYDKRTQQPLQNPSLMAIIDNEAFVSLDALPTLTAPPLPLLSEFSASAPNLEFRLFPQWKVLLA